MTTTASRFRRVADNLTTRIGSVPDDRWEAPSPCEGWTARDVVQHLVDVLARTPGFVGLSIPPGPSVADDPVAAWAHVRDAMQEILDDPERANREYDGYFGRTTLAATVDSFVCFDLIVHGWDLARAAGLDETIPPHDVEDAFVLAEQLGDNLRQPGVCGPAVAVADGADRQTKLLAFLGRTP
ncbi:TIGR03086 family protein [Actinobacteria bacterium YIM 96077]|uniref:TIGR03086 family protein n=1 Tax=Phytoactinopolyspora halophila TaxID=1981511 RepID=A0A329R4M3_9ACTN|nr:TIGR03086 family metal-binding protein [Phytoactinopolyspora halophila]AYY11450.1 TIGR03086 family protein [Actinobacteria bacterium YIM 96077]RAW18068.1 TIGR03086 family protein [Phytoactinopolyspora halophila]